MIASIFFTSPYPLRVNPAPLARAGLAVATSDPESRIVPMAISAT
jgi:hypothetical protein